METGALGKRLFLGVICLVVAPIAGLASAASLTNPPGDGPGAGQLLAGVGVPVCIAGIAALVTRTRRAEASLWATLSLVATGALVLCILWVVAANAG